MTIPTVEPWRVEFYLKAMDVLEQGAVPFLVGGAYAFENYTDIARDTCDFDLFVLPQDVNTAFAAMEGHGWRTERSFPHWLGKVHYRGAYVDIIYSSGSGVAVVDPLWFEHAEAGTVLGRAVRLIPAEEMIWSKAFIMERERFDGNDVLHVLHSRGDRLDWQRLFTRFGRHWRVLMAHVVLYGFVYPGERSRIPAYVTQWFLDRFAAERGDDPAGTGVCQGTLLSREQYLTDLERWGYRDGRLSADVRMDEQDIAHWTAAISERDK